MPEMSGLREASVTFTQVFSFHELRWECPCFPPPQLNMSEMANLLGTPLSGIDLFTVFYFDERIIKI